MHTVQKLAKRYRFTAKSLSQSYKKYNLKIGYFIYNINFNGKFNYILLNYHKYHSFGNNLLSPFYRIYSFSKNKTTILSGAQIILFCAGKNYIQNRHILRANAADLLPYLTIIKTTSTLCCTLGVSEQF